MRYLGGISRTSFVKGAFRLTAVFAIFLIAVGCGCDNVAVHGDSTAIGSRGGIYRIYNFAPALDRARWWNIVSKSRPQSGSAFNDAAGGQGVRELREKMVADVRHRRITTIIYDRRNPGETAEYYVDELSLAVATLDGRRFLILPQVPGSQSYVETDATQAQTMAQIDSRVRAKWPNNSFSKLEAEALVNALQADSTRYDNLHRNALGQSIEARLVNKWLARRGW